MNRLRQHAGQVVLPTPDRAFNSTIGPRAKRTLLRASQTVKIGRNAYRNAVEALYAYSQRAKNRGQARRAVCMA